jgi:hypothetical protein
LVLDLFALDSADRHGMQRDLKTWTSPVDVDLRIRNPMEDEGCRPHPELSSSTNTAVPLHDEIDVEREIAGPVSMVRGASAEFDRPNVTVVPREAIKVSFCVSHCFSASPLSILTWRAVMKLPNFGVILLSLPGTCQVRRENERAQRIDLPPLLAIGLK